MVDHRIAGVAGREGEKRAEIGLVRRERAVSRRTCPSPRRSVIGLIPKAAD